MSNYYSDLTKNMYNWNELTSYKRDQLVLFNNTIYRSLINENLGNIPLGSTKWQSML